jgi:hypothetical protein
MYFIDAVCSGLGPGSALGAALDIDLVLAGVMKEEQTKGFVSDTHCNLQCSYASRKQAFWGGTFTITLRSTLLVGGC